MYEASVCLIIRKFEIKAVIYCIYFIYKEIQRQRNEEMTDEKERDGEIQREREYQ